MIHVWGSEDSSVELLLSFYLCWDPGVQLRLPGLHSKGVYQLSSLTDPIAKILSSSFIHKEQLLILT